MSSGSIRRDERRSGATALTSLGRFRCLRWPADSCCCSANQDRLSSSGISRWSNATIKTHRPQTELESSCPAQTDSGLCLGCPVPSTALRTCPARSWLHRRKPNYTVYGSAVSVARRMFSCSAKVLWLAGSAVAGVEALGFSPASSRVEIHGLQPRHPSARRVSQSPPTSQWCV